MKTTILSFITALFMVTGLANTSNANALKDDDFTQLNDISAITKIEVHGNVELYVSDATTDQVRVYNKYYAESALVQSLNGVLRISSYKAEKLVVWVSASDLRSISMFDNSEVKSFGKLSKIDFNVDLHGSAVATLNLDAFNATLTVKDNAVADVKGSAQQLNLDRNIESNVKSNEFAVTHLFENKPAFTASFGRQAVGM